MNNTYDSSLDAPRLTAQLQRVYDVMASGSWYTLREIAARTGDPEASISARLRDLRNGRQIGRAKWTPKYPVCRRRRGDPKLGIWEYALVVERPVVSEPVVQELPL